MQSQSSISSRRQTGGWAKRFFGPSRQFPDTRPGFESAPRLPVATGGDKEAGEGK